MEQQSAPLLLEQFLNQNSVEVFQNPDMPWCGYKDIVATSKIDLHMRTDFRVASEPLISHCMLLKKRMMQ